MEGNPPPGSNHQRNLHEGVHARATRPGCPPHKRAARGGGAADGRRPSQRRAHRVPQAHHSPSGRPAHMQGTPARRAMLGTSLQKCTMRSQRQALPPAPHHTHSMCCKTGRYKHRKATGGLYPVPALRNSDTTMAELTAPRKTRPRSPALDAAHQVIRALGLQTCGEPPPPPGGRRHGLRTGADPRGPRRRRAGGTHAAGGQRASPLPCVDAGALHQRGLVPQATPPVRKSHCHVFLGGLDPGQAPLKILLLMLRQT